MTAGRNGAIPRGLVVSCQPVPGGPTDRPDFVVAFACAARDGGAAGLRIEGVGNVRAVAAACDLPVVGLVKRDLDGTAVRITPFVADAVALARAGAGIVAFDATDRPRPAAVADLVAAIRAEGALAMADVATEAEARAAVAAGVDIVGTTLSGYTGPGPVPRLPDVALVRDCVPLGRPVFAEGRYNTPGLAREAVRAGAAAVVVGSAITRPEHVTAWFAAAVAPPARREPVLALDIGGTKIAVALVADGTVLDRAEAPTPRGRGFDGWLDVARDAARPWSGRYRGVAAAVSGLVRGGRWDAVNPAVLPVPAGYPLTDRLHEAFGGPTLAVNDAQAAAWGEFRHGAGAGRDLLFVTVSTGIGGGLVLGGRLVEGRDGLAGHLGQIRLGGRRLEDVASGSAFAGEAAAVLAAADAGETGAVASVGAAVDVLADALRDVQMLLSPDLVVLGGGLGLAPGFRDRLGARLAVLPDLERPTLVPALLGRDAGLVGAAALWCDREDA